MKKITSALLALLVALQGAYVALASNPPAEVFPAADIELKESTAFVYENGPINVDKGTSVTFRATLDTTEVKNAVKAYYEKAVSEAERIANGDNAAKEKILTDVAARPITGRFEIKAVYPSGVSIATAYKSGTDMYGFNDEAKKAFKEISRTETTNGGESTLTITVEPKSPTGAASLTVGDLCANSYAKLGEYLPNLTLEVGTDKMNTTGTYTVTATLTGYTDFGYNSTTQVTYTAKQAEAGANPAALNTVSATVKVKSDVSGHITNSGSDKITNVTVELKKGDETVKEIHNDDNPISEIGGGSSESYEIKNVEEGAYNTVISDGATTKTTYTEIDGSSDTTQAVDFKPGLSSVVEIDAANSDTGTTAGSHIRKTVVDGLDKEIEDNVPTGNYDTAEKSGTKTPKEAYDDDGKAELTLLVSSKEEIAQRSEGESDSEKIRNGIYDSQQLILQKVKEDTQSGYTYRIDEYFDLTLKLKWWDKYGNKHHKLPDNSLEKDGTTIATAKGTLHIAFDYPVETGKEIKLYRHHGNDTEATALTKLDAMPTDFSVYDNGTNPPAYYVDETRGIIHIFARNFSLYALVTQTATVPSGGSSSSSAYRLVFNIDGKTGDISPISGKRGSKVLVSALPTPVKDGYTFDGWYTDAARTQKVTEDIVLTGNVVLYGHWISGILESETHFAYIKGYPDGTVRPNDNITREESATVLYRLLSEEYRQELESKAESNAFSDMESDRWSYVPVSTLAGGGYIKGYEDGTFRPENPITRAEFAAMVTRFVSLYEVGEPIYSDITGHWGEIDILKASAAGWVQGYEDGTFRPEGYITRAEVMTIVNRMLSRAVNQDGISENVTSWSDLKENDWCYYEVQEATNAHNYIRGEDGITEIWTK